MKKFIILFVAIILSITAAAARHRVSLNDDWRFYFTSENSADYARTISLPHTWAFDSSRSVASAQPTTANYLRNIFVPAEWGNKRLFLKFYGVESVAELFVNGQYVGEHRGGSTAFTFEITSKIKAGEQNRVQVIVNNAPQNDVLPTSREEDYYGGIYRDVELIVTDKSAISPLYYGSEGVLVDTEEVEEDKVEGSVKVFLNSTTSSVCALTLSILDAEGNSVYQRLVTKAKVGEEPVEIPFVLSNPKLWSTAEPNLYTFVVELFDGEMTDKVSVRSGFRSIDTNYDGLISFNDVPTQVRAVAMYHDYPYVGGAASKRDIATDMALVKELGANTIRSANRPHSRDLYDMCDEQGVLSWIDFPLVKSPFLSDIAYYPTERFKEQGRQTMREIIAQNYNHPSVIMWGVFSLMSSRGDDALPYIKELNKIAKDMDSSRPTVAVSNQDGDINKITDLVVWKQNLGWERGLYSDIDVWSNILHTDWKSLRSGVAYGENGRIDQQSKRADFNTASLLNATTWFPEARQRAFHEQYSQRLLSDSLFWGVCLTNMFDFKSVRNPMGENNSGLVSFDRRDRKDVFYLYKANWNKSEPTLYIAGRRERVVRDSVRKVVVYASDTVAPTLYFNSDTVVMKPLRASQFVADSVILRQGVNRIVVKQGELVDSVEFSLQQTNKGQTLMARPSFRR